MTAASQSVDFPLPRGIASAKFPPASIDRSILSADFFVIVLIEGERNAAERLRFAKRYQVPLKPRLSPSRVFNRRDRPDVAACPGLLFLRRCASLSVSTITLGIFHCHRL